eukprot:1176658-Prorocentrum_minimum.AAC.1
MPAGPAARAASKGGNTAKHVARPSAQGPVERALDEGTGCRECSSNLETRVERLRPLHCLLQRSQ